MKYRLGACTTALKELENGLGSTDFHLIRKLGVAREILTALSYMPHHFCSMELDNLLVETTVAQIKCLLQHDGTDTTLENTATAAVEHM